MLTQHTKLVKRIALMLLPIGLFAFSCEDNSLPENCLPYEGEFFDSGNVCSGFVIKVLNKDVNSGWNRGDAVFQNVIGVRFDSSIVDSAFIGKRFFFDLRELKSEEMHPCPSLWTAPDRIVFITKASFDRCGHSPIN
jgi:hypothetical protein